ncbi:PGN_0703 family putative restriction endonuclease [Xinfangfangia pollutisoli]|uniref:PGN_0703 family putative restriction endonuclease n=1 Tax=Xinfangfangia pollutisoli TaxID=2865960 RepID=UPI001CD43ABE|nr:hypothetical protein [Xinfangfangia pollutisoli]
MTDPEFLPGVPADLVLQALRRAPGKELASGKFDSPDSSAALAANAFGWFLTRPQALPPLPGVPMGRPDTVEIEASLRFPWRGGEHPWLDAVISSATTLVGVESKRYEPFRPKKRSEFSPAYAAQDWGRGLTRWHEMRRALAEGRQVYRCLDAVQLVKHAYGLATQGAKRGRGAVLVYLHAAPAQWSNGKLVDPAAIARHAAEISDFARAVQGDLVSFVPLRWADLLAQWAAEPALAAHAAALRDRFGPL